MDKQTIPISKLLVNPENPRFEPVRSQQEAINLMLDKAGSEVLNLAKDIVQHGLNPSKSLMVMKVEGGKFLPLEGNRRVVALKLLRDPQQTTNTEFIEKFNVLKREYAAQIPSEVECVIFPDRESAFRWVNLEHTGRNKGVGILDWDSTQRQRFIAQYSGKKPARPVQLFDFASQNKLDYTKVDSTTLDRLVSTPFVREQIGISFPGGILALEKSKAQVVKNLRKVFLEMSKKNFKVGDVYTEDKRKDWIKQVLGVSEKTKAIKKIISRDILDGDWITGALYNAYPDKNRVKAILGELKDLSPGQKPNICATSLRVLLELAVYVFLKKKKQISIIIIQERQKLIKENKKRKSKRQLDRDWSPGFQRTLAHMATEEKLVPDPLERKALKTFISKKSNEPFLVELNQFIHNPDYEPNPETVIEIWKRLGKLIFRNILAERK